MLVHGPLADEQPPRDGAGGVTVRDERQHSDLARG
jgi:hypothetical protein